MEVLAELAGIIAVFALATVVIVRYQRGLDEPGGRPTPGFGDAFNPVNEIFHPAAHRATQELKRYDEKVETMPSPDGPLPDDGPVRLERGKDGLPSRVHVRRPDGPATGQ